MDHPVSTLSRWGQDGAMSTVAEVGTCPDSMVVYRLRVVLAGISPLIWRGLLVPDTATIADLHTILQIIEDLAVGLDIDGPSGSQTKLLKTMHEFDSYVHANATRIPHYGKRRRAGEAISTSFVESAVNQLINKRTVTKQQMRWTPQGAHLLLQIRTRVLNDQLADDFHRWYTAFTHAPDTAALAA